MARPGFVNFSSGIRRVLCRENRHVLPPHKDTPPEPMKPHPKNARLLMERLPRESVKLRNIRQRHELRTNRFGHV